MKPYKTCADSITVTTFVGWIVMLKRSSNMYIGGVIAHDVTTGDNNILATLLLNNIKDTLVIYHMLCGIGVIGFVCLSWVHYEQ